MPESEKASPGGPETARTTRAQLGLLGAILVLAVALRVWGVSFGLPDLYHPDEPNKIVASLKVFRTGNLNPEYFLKPGLLIYLNSAAHVPYYWYGRLTDRFRTREDMQPPKIVAMGVARSPIPAVFLIGRLLSAAFSVATVALLFVAARRVSGSAWAGLGAALFLAVSPGHVEQGHYITPDSHVVFFGVLALVASLGVMRRGRVRDIVFAGAAVGLAAASKYNGLAFFVLPVAAHFLGRGRAGWRDGRFWAYLPVSAIVAFLVFNPYAVLSPRAFFGALFDETRHYATEGHTGMEGGAALWYLKRLALWEGPVLLLAIWQLWRARRRRVAWLVALFPILYGVAICLIRVRNPRTVLPALPFLFLLAGWGVAELAARIGDVRIRRIVVACVLLVLLALPAVRSGLFDRRLATPDGRRDAAAWIARHLAPDSLVIVESYGAYVDPQRYRVLGAMSLASYPVGEYLRNRVRYLVMGSEMIDRYGREPERYAERLARYRQLEQRFETVARFDKGGTEVRIYDLARLLRTDTPPTRTP